MAALDLQNGDKVIDVALRYGYESPTSFNRAFQKVHGVSPSAAQKEGTVLKTFPRISFKITIKGDTEMEYRIVNKEAFRVVGVQVPLSNDIEKNFQEVPKFWQQVAQNGTLSQIVPLMNAEPMGVLGITACGNENESWKYYVAVSTDLETPDGMVEYVVPEFTWAVFPGQGTMPTSIQETEKRAVTEWLPTSGYEYADGPDIEVYINADPANAKFEVWLPIAKKK